VLHRCDVKACCNPAHLYLGTRADNARDSRERGQMFVPRRVRLNDVAAAVIRFYLDRGLASTFQLAEAYGVKPHTISGIKSGRHWKRALAATR
jgi:hypothetical protein